MCVTEKEKLTTVTQNDRVSILEKKLDNMQTDFRDELSAMKDILSFLRQNCQFTVTFA